MQDGLSHNLLEDSLRNNKKETLEKLFKKYYKVLVIFAKNYVKDRSIAEDLVQDVFVMLFEKADTIQIHSSIKSFLYTSVRNHTLNYIKKTKNDIFDNEAINYDYRITDDEQIIDIAELSEKLYKAIELLPKQNKKIFKLSRLDGYTNQEIADQLGLTKRTVETHITNALKKLRELVKKNKFNFFLLFLRVFIFWLS